MYVNNTALKLSITTDGSEIIKLKLGDLNLPDGENGWKDLIKAELEDDP